MTWFAKFSVAIAILASIAIIFGLASLIAHGPENGNAVVSSTTTAVPSPLSAASPTPQPSASPLEPTPGQPASQPISIPSKEAALISVVTDFAGRYESAPNEFAKSAMRRERATAIAQITSAEDAISDWVGTLAGMTTTHDGNGAIAVKAANARRLTIKTWNNSFSDIGDATLIPSGSPLYSDIEKLHVGQLVIFSGKFIEGKQDFLKEASMTEAGSMGDPEFLFRFSSIRALAPEDQKD